ncbi:hypothetical protein MGSAQ_002168 [marine sediment metagenome]|uniref:Uncharacterized protein n=1 Tax=marine sediment metagenome TaxID=412755 RepID=A0A1B6NS78_9ZZZZ
MAKITSFIPPAAKRASSSVKPISSGPTPSIGDKCPISTKYCPL